MKFIYNPEMKFIFNSNALRKLRISKNLTQEDLADILQTSQKLISLLENGKIENPSFRLVIKVSIALGVPAEYFASP